jgi:hypothetical protein
MTAARTAFLGFLSLTMLSCSSVAPVKVVAGDQCFRCRRIIHDERIAAERIDGNYFAAKFRGPACMAKYIVGHPDPGASVFVTDYGSGKMIAPTNALFVPVVVDRQTNETEYRAYRQEADAVAAAAGLHVMPVTWDAVLDKAR